MKSKVKLLALKCNPRTQKHSAVTYAEYLDITLNFSFVMDTLIFLLVTYFEQFCCLLVLLFW